MRILARPIVWATFLTLHHQYYQRTCGLTSAFPVKSIVSSRSPFRTLLTTISSSLTATTSAELTKLSMTRTEKASYIDYVSQTVSEAVGTLVELESTMGGGYSGGGGAQTGAIKDAITGKRYFIKAARDGADMLQAEYFGVKEMSDTNTIRCPRPVAFGVYEPTNMAFCVFEYLEFCGGGSQDELGRQLAKMHRHFSDKGFGFHIDNTIGATPQPNGWKDTWVDFWLEHRLGHMLKLTGDAGLSKEKVKQLQEKHRELLAHQPQPSLIHGDLWGGNKGFCRGEGGTVQPVIFDPATYYGDREADVAMTYLFGGFSSDFYRGYEDEWPLPSGHEKRRTIYNLYHILNHDVLFGGMYLSQARGMIDQILRM